MRCISLFNQALLAKQGWLLLTQPESILASLFKSVYYPDTSFLEPSLGSKPSPYWRGLIWGRDILSAGISWRLAMVIKSTSGRIIGCLAVPILNFIILIRFQIT